MTLNLDKGSLGCFRLISKWMVLLQLIEFFLFIFLTQGDLTHKLPLEGLMDPRDSYTKIYDELFQFLSKGTRHIPPIHVQVISIISSILHFLFL